MFVGKMAENEDVKTINQHINVFISKPSIVVKTQYMCSKCGFGIIISEGIIDYALNVMLLVQYDSRRVVVVS